MTLDFVSVCCYDSISCISSECTFTRLGFTSSISIPILDVQSADILGDVCLALIILWCSVLACGPSRLDLPRSGLRVFTSTVKLRGTCLGSKSSSVSLILQILSSKLDSSIVVLGAYSLSTNISRLLFQLMIFTCNDIAISSSLENEVL